MRRKFYITTAIDYTNDVIHIGHAYQKIVSDTLARYHRLNGDEVFFLTGTDEHGGTSEQAAKKAGKTPTQYVDEISRKDKLELDALDISYDRFIRTTDKDHKETVVDFYDKVRANGDIYKGKYEGFYCVGCESYKTLSEIKDGKCPLHPTRELEKISEENYFFRWSKYADFLKEHIEKNKDFIKPLSQRKSMLGFLDGPLEDIAISRPKSKVSWGIEVPNDPEHVIYVWFDALINYISGGKDFWPADVHVLGKDNTRWHALLWPAMLKSAGYPLPGCVWGHGFITLEGQKISKSLGNVIRPTEVVKTFGIDPVRYYFIRFGPWLEDSDISLEKIKNAYNDDLANGLGNLVSRTAKLCEKSGISFTPSTPKLFESVRGHFKSLRPDLAAVALWQEIKSLDKFINQEAPWNQKGEELNKTLATSVEKIRQIGWNLKPLLPRTADKILKQFGGKKIKSESPLFPRA